MMICIFLHLLLVFCFSPPNISKRFCCWQLFWKAIETRPRRLLVFILGLIQIGVTFYAGENLFCQQVQWLPRWLNLRCWSRIWIEDLVSWLRRLLVGLKRMVGYGWKVCWMGVILFWLMMTNSFIVVKRRIVWGWKSGWLEFRDWLFVVDRLVGWGWEIGWLGLRGTKGRKYTLCICSCCKLAAAPTATTPRRRGCSCRNEKKTETWNATLDRWKYDLLKSCKIRLEQQLNTYDQFKSRTV